MFLSDVEVEVFNMTHATAGAYFANTWRLPKFVVESIRYHHQPSLTPNRTDSCRYGAHGGGIW